MVVGSLTRPVTWPARAWWSRSTSSTRNSTITLWLSAGREEPAANSATVRVWAMATVAPVVLISAKSSVDQAAGIPVAFS